MSQNSRIFEHLSSGRSLTALEAFTRFRSCNCHSRISDLRAKGFIIDCRRVDKGHRVDYVYSMPPLPKARKTGGVK